MLQSETKYSQKASTLNEINKYNWYVISCAGGKENKIAKILQQKIKVQALESYVTDVIVPMREKIIIKKGKKESTSEMLFPGYLLIRMIVNDDTLNLLKTTEGIKGFAGTRKNILKPTPISEKEAKAILEFVKIKSSPVYSSKLSVGDAVKIVEGAFKDFIGNISEVNETKGQVTVLISIFDRETPVTLDFLQVSKL